MQRLYILIVSCRIVRMHMGVAYNNPDGRLQRPKIKSKGLKSNAQIKLTLLNFSRLQEVLLWNPKGSVVATDAHPASALNREKCKQFLYIHSLKFNFVEFLPRSIEKNESSFSIFTR